MRFVFRFLMLMAFLSITVPPLLDAAASPPSLVKKKQQAPQKTYAAPALPHKVQRNKAAQPEKDWTVLYYLDADNNLEPFMLDDVDEMEQIGSTDNVNLIALVDRNPGYDDRDGNWTNNKAMFVVHDTNNAKLASKVLEDYPEMDMADPETLARFVPAGQYVVLLIAYGADGEESGYDYITIDSEGGDRVAPHLTYPDYGYPSVAVDDLAYVDLQVIIGPEEYDHFDATWDDYDFMDSYEANDYDADDLTYLDDVALDDEDLEFDEDDFYDYDDEEVVAPGDQEEEEEGNTIENEQKEDETDQGAVDEDEDEPDDDNNQDDQQK